MKLLLSMLTFIACCALSVPAYPIKKCKDADGNMHYGDTAMRVCENSKITTLTDRGFIKEEVDAPKSAEQVKAEMEAKELLEREQQDKLAADEEKRRILSIYETEDDIVRQRDNQVRSVQSNIDVHESYLSNMEKRLERYKQKLAASENKRVKKLMQENIAEATLRVQEYTDQLAALEQQKVEILARFKQERETYLALKSSNR